MMASACLKTLGHMLTLQKKAKKAGYRHQSRKGDLLHKFIVLLSFGSCPVGLLQVIDVVPGLDP